MKLLCSDELPFAPIFMRKFNKRNLLNQPYKVFCLVILQIKRYLKTWKSVFLLDRHQQGPIRLVLLVITGLVGWLVIWLFGWLVGWLVGNAVFSETCSKDFSDFLRKVRGYKGRKVTEPDFWKKFLIWRYWQKSLQISPKSDTLIFFSKTALTIFFGFWPEVSTKYELQFEWNLFFRKNCNFEIYGLEIIKKLSKLRFSAIFSTLHY